MLDVLYQASVLSTSYSGVECLTFYKSRASQREKLRRLNWVEMNGMPLKEDESVWQKAISHVVVALVAGSLTFGISESSNAKARTLEVARVGMRLSAMEDELRQEARSREKADEETNAAVNRLSSRLDKLIDLCTQLLAQLRVKSTP